MINYINGDIFDSGADVILHQVNCRGVMGSGIAKQVRDKFPFVYWMYKMACEMSDENLLGVAQVVPVCVNQYIINLFAQDGYGRDGRRYTDYEALRKSLRFVGMKFSNKKIAIPYFMGCGLGGGDWNVVLKIIEEELGECDVAIYRI